ncbi:glycosyltransferase [Paenibacillus dokdonensis]|uniref:glycosyltransferase n=1 Tax=Paenibacillus dokdonensis TaxID=2567944 RepID=UPI001457D677|nr:glycosyltransferase [Paenibacillus dokdonensis]
MNEHKICFITCTNDEILYEECARYIRSLVIPKGYEIELIAVKGAKSMTEGYNHAMRQSNAKYKVYLHQDTYIINKSFVQNVVSLFLKYSNLGLLGVVGAKKVPPSGIWLKAKERYGTVYETNENGTIDISLTKEVNVDYESAEYVNGLIMITQYDLTWRDDLLNGWHMYDASQCVEFLREGYEVGIPSQHNPWVIHDCVSRNLEGYEQERLIFLKEYSKDIFPLVSVLIPAYNRPQMLEEAIKSVLNQTYINIEIIVSDDSTNNEVGEMLSYYLSNHLNIKYYKNDEPYGSENFGKCLNKASGKYISYLMDDDLYHSEKIEKMVSYLEEYQDVTLVTSYRELIDDYGRRIPDSSINQKIFSEDTIINGIDAGNFMLKKIYNFIGEPTTTMFRKQDLDKNFGWYKGKKIRFINDVATWINLLRKGKLVYISEPLSYFRQHEGQNQGKLDYLKFSIEGWLNMIVASREDGFLLSQNEFKTALKEVYKLALHAQRKFVEQDRYDLLEETDFQISLKNLYKQLEITFALS